MSKVVGDFLIEFVPSVVSKASNDRLTMIVTIGYDLLAMT